MFLLLKFRCFSIIFFTFSIFIFRRNIIRKKIFNFVCRHFLRSFASSSWWNASTDVPFGVVDNRNERASQDVFLVGHPTRPNFLWVFRFLSTTIQKVNLRTLQIFTFYFWNFTWLPVRKHFQIWNFWVKLKSLIWVPKKTLGSGNFLEFHNYKSFLFIKFIQQTLGKT